MSHDATPSRAGIVAGDVILAVEDRSVDGLADFCRKLWAQGRAGVEVRLTVRRDAATRDVTIKSEDRYDWLKLKRSY